MTKLIAKLVQRLQGENGQALAEYGLIIAFIAIVAVVALAALGAAVGIPFAEFTAGLPD